MNLERLVHIDRRIIYLLIALGTTIPLLLPIGLPVSSTPPVERLFDKIEGLGQQEVVLVSFDYGPTTAPENNPMAQATLRHCFTRGVKVVVVALFPIGGVTMAGEILEGVAGEYPDLEYGVDYAFLGYKDGAQAAMKQMMGNAFAEVFPQDFFGTDTNQLPLMRRVVNHEQIALVVSFSTNIIGEWWANLVNAQYGTPVAVGTTAVSAPKYYAFLDSGQMLGLLGGLKGASEYEQLLIDAHPELMTIYQQAGIYTAMKGMDAQTVDHAIIMLFIIFGNTVYFLVQRRDARRKQHQA